MKIFNDKALTTYSQADEISVNGTMKRNYIKKKSNS